jgi:two-component system OmpR family response regulator
MNPNLILIAEDDPDLCGLLSFTIETAGFHTVGAEDGDSAARLLTTAQPIGMITDLAMPGADGVQLCQLARSNPANRDMAIIMISGHDDPHRVETGLRAGADRYLAKPLSSRTITAALRRAIDRRHPTGGNPAPA